MASETTTETVVGKNTRIEPWQGGVVGGLVGGAVMGIMLTMQMTPVIENAIPAMYGLSGGAAGWVIHMVHAAILGVGFAAVATRFDLAPAAVYRALAYYHEHPDEMTAIDDRRDALLDELAEDTGVPTSPEELTVLVDDESTPD